MVRGRVVVDEHGMNQTSSFLAPLRRRNFPFQQLPDRRLPARDHLVGDLALRVRRVLGQPDPHDHAEVVLACARARSCGRRSNQLHHALLVMRLLERALARTRPGSPSRRGSRAGRRPAPAGTGGDHLAQPGDRLERLVAHQQRARVRMPVAVVDRGAQLVDLGRALAAVLQDRAGPTSSAIRDRCRRSCFQNSALSRSAARSWSVSARSRLMKRIRSLPVERVDHPLAGLLADGRHLGHHLVPLLHRVQQLGRPARARAGARGCGRPRRCRSRAAAADAAASSCPRRAAAATASTGTSSAGVAGAAVFCARDPARLRSVLGHRAGR